MSPPQGVARRRRAYGIGHRSISRMNLNTTSRAFTRTCSPSPTSRPKHFASGGGLRLGDGGDKHVPVAVVTGLGWKPGHPAHLRPRTSRADQARSPVGGTKADGMTRRRRACVACGLSGSLADAETGHDRPLRWLSFRAPGRSPPSRLPGWGCARRSGKVAPARSACRQAESASQPGSSSPTRVVRSTPSVCHRAIGVPLASAIKGQQQSLTSTLTARSAPMTAKVPTLSSWQRRSDVSRRPAS